MEIGGAKSEVAHRTELQGRSQAVGVALIAINEGPIMLGQGEIGDQIPLRNRIGETGEPYKQSLRVKNGLGMVGCIP